MCASFRNSEDLSKVTVEEAMNLRAAQFLLSVLCELTCNPGGNGIVSGGCDARYRSIVAQSVVPVPSDFDARYSAHWKHYAYYVCSGSGGGGFLTFAWSFHLWLVNMMIDVAVMMSTGKRNFEWMCVVHRGCA